MKQKHTKGPWEFRQYFGGDEEAKKQIAMGMTPTRILMNNGACSIIGGEHDDHIAFVTCQSEFKRGQGHIAECETRDANARLIAKAPQMLEALKFAVRSYKPTQMVGANQWVYPDWYNEAVAIINELEPV